ncbi:unnamed protein product [Musa hybrid cultivar]
MRKARVDLEDSARTLNRKPKKVAPSSFDFPGKDTKHFNKAPNLSSSLQAVEAAQGFSHGRGRIIPSLSNERQDGFFYRDNHMNLRRTAQAVHGHNHFGVNKKYSSHKTFEVSRELVYGPRANKSNSCLGSSTRNNNLNQFVRRDKYNKTDFQIEYENAKFFMIKSYNEDDVHKSVKYNVWASTPNGNKKLDAVFWDAERLMKKGSKCPIFLFFSVNASGQFVGLAEMIGPVDFNKNLDFWQKETWNGFFPVKWHIIKDIPNRLFQSIRLENNDNKAVTFSKDTQEIGLPQGLQMLHIFKGHPLGTSLLDDFGFYEHREKSLQATRRRRPAVMDVDFEFYDDSCGKIGSSSK